MDKDRSYILITIFIVVVFIIAGIFLGISIIKPQQAQKEDDPEEHFLHPPIAPLENMEVSENSGQQYPEFQGERLAGNPSPLLEYVPSDYAKAQDSGKLIVLYFYANWCPICKEEVSSSLLPAFNELERDDVIGFRVNFNDSDTDKSEQELARQFGVAYQHTKVFLKNGERVLKSPESWDKDRYFEEINKAVTN